MNMSATFIKAATLVVAGLLWSSVSFGKTFDVSKSYRCDAIFTSSGCTGGTAAHEQVRAAVGDNVGIVVPAARGSLPPLRRKVIRIERLNQATTGIANRVDSEQASRDFAANTGATGQTTDTTTPTIDDGSPTSRTSGTTAASRDNDLNLGAPTGSIASPQSQQLKAGGFLYANDEPESVSKNSPTAESIGTGRSSLLGQTQASGEAAVKANRKSSGGGDSESSPFSPASQQGAGFGQFESGSGAAAPAQSLAAKVTDGLASIAGSLGEKFFGALGGRRSGNKGSRGNASTDFGAKAKSGKKSPKIDKNFLKRGLARFNAQGTGHPEFAGAQSFLFNSMCNHYVTYARNNRIPNDRSPCPRK